jgi:hypothetical protein
MLVSLVTLFLQAEQEVAKPAHTNVVLMAEQAVTVAEQAVVLIGVLQVEAVEAVVHYLVMEE